MAQKAALALAFLALAGCMPALKMEVVDVEARNKINEVIAECCPQEVDNGSQAD